MPALDDVYRKFGETAEAAQLLETELGTLLLMARGTDENLIADPNPERARDLYDSINRHTLGQLLRSLNKTTPSLDALHALLTDALRERNRLCHSFYRQHNLRRNSDDGRMIMMRDLETIHDTLLQAYKSLMLLSGVDLDALADTALHNPPTRRLPI